MSATSSSARRRHSTMAMPAARASVAASALSAQARVDSPTTPLLSRPTSAAMHGKQAATLKTSVTDEAKEAFARWWRERGYASESDCLRELVLVAVYGPEHLTDLHRQRIQSLVQRQAGIGTETTA